MSNLLTDIILFQWHLKVGGIYWVASQHFVPELDVLDAENMGKRKESSDFDKFNTVMARQPAQSKSKTSDEE